MIERRAFVVMSGLGLVPTVLSRFSGAAALDGSLAKIDDPSGSFPAQDPALVRSVVGGSHGNFELVEELVTAYPELAKASIDWGFGDWESALGAAAHTGRREIAQLLLANGARPNLFSAAMLGQFEVVKATVEASPGIQRTLGPHGITLLAHARFGGEPAAQVHEYLEGLGDADNGPRSAPLPAGTSAPDFLGMYRYGPADDERLEVTDRDGTLFLGRVDYVARGLTHLGQLEFFPAGAPSVRIAFQPLGATPLRVRVTAGAIDITARREG